ncbi:glycosyltransferase family protein [Thermoflexibacter ruber]|uniref:UDP-glucoronosyl and UDP-glucosyl transferase n=1 Tax=Thermoflexibacter ruber TaxID=1003 RepID=A0A1I2FYA4_9BACT|nr:hypothetical protein [Thermoflexibacter ruber]SFF09486.1 hypothetical protein SAMN04488541_1015102 [Thermoflexibacter ruber]
MKNILLLLHIFESHYTPTFQLAKLLQSQGYQAVYAVPERYKAHIEAQGFTSITLLGFPFGLGFEKDNREFEKSQDLYLDVLLDKISNRIYEDRKAKLSQIVDALQPTLILIDMWISTDLIMVYPKVWTNKATRTAHQSPLQAKPTNLQRKNRSKIYRGESADPL